jgi:hypothetical protein
MRHPMNDPILFGIAPGTTNEPVIWAIDNAWFDSYDEHNISLDDLLRRDLKKGISTSRTLGELREVIEAGTLKGHGGDLEYLGVLVDLCIQNNLQLGLCNFDCFRDRFLLLNQPGSAILLDVHYPGSHKSGYPPAEYGIYLLHEVLNGSRPRADIFLVTGYETLARKVIGNKRYVATWWPLTGIQIVDKSDEKLKDSLDAFVKYFVQGLDRDPFIKLARGLIAARRAGNTHPMSLEKLLESSQGLPLAESFARLERERKSQGLTSFKSLYHSRGQHGDEGRGGKALEVAESSEGGEPLDESGFPSGEDKVAVGVLVDHCRFLGIDLNVEDCSEVYLPIQPGLVFILFFCAFIRLLEEKPTVQLSCAQNQGGGRGKLFIPLKSTDDLLAAVYASESLGDATLWFKRALTGRGEWVFELAKESVVNQRIPWKCPTSKGRTYPLIVRPTFLANGIELVWEWPPHG